MTPQQIVGLAARLFSIWIALSAIQMLVFGLSADNQLNIDPTPAPYVIAGLELALACFLWFFPMFISHKLIPRTRFEDVLRVQPSEAVVVACVIFGLWLFVSRVLPSMSYYAALVAVTVKNGQRIADMDQSLFMRLVSGLVEFGVVILLIVKSRAISAMLLAHRGRGGEE